MYSLHRKLVTFSCTFLLCALFLVYALDAKDLDDDVDLLALLSIKARIRSDPYQIMPSWNDSTHVCNWTGITCSPRHQRVVTLNLWSGGFSGSLSPAVGNLSFLTALILHNNSFTGNLPQEIGNLSRLRRLGVSNNSLSGEIPSNISHCHNLVELDLSGNSFKGVIPTQFESLTKLLFINLHSNNLTGEIPKFIGNFTSLTFISGLGNSFHGSIPDTLGRLSDLWFFGFAMNKLSGVLPVSFFNLSSLAHIDLPDNQITGSLPSDIAQSFPNLIYLNLPINNISGPIPVSLSNATNLQLLALNENAFIGTVPSFHRLQRLTRFAVNDNLLGDGRSDNLNFVSSLANCTNLTKLGFGANNLGGVLPKSIFNFTQLTDLTGGANLISGNIPSEIGQLINIRRFFLFSNQLSGTIPDEIGTLQNLGTLSLRGNLLSGYIPFSLGNLTQLNRLFLYHNNLEGHVPSSLSNCKGLQLLDLSRNNLSGNVPKEIFGLSSLTISLDLSNNRFVGSLPSEVGSLQNLVSFDVSNNMFSGMIPASFGACTSLVVLSLSGNAIQGEIPGTFSALRGLEVLDLSRNNLTGLIPGYLGEFLFFKSLNLSFNGFDGNLPEKGAFSNVSKVSVTGNDMLCGGLPEFNLPKCSRNESSSGNQFPLSLTIAIPLLTVISILILVVIFCFICKPKYSRKISAGSILDSENFPNVSYKILHKATEGFSVTNLIGSGRFGSVYKVVLSQKKGPQTVAVKVLKLAVDGAHKSFIAECEALRSIRHRNLVKIITSCATLDFQGRDFKALVYPYMINGSLEDWLHQDPVDGLVNEESSRHLNFLQRLNIIIDVASSLDYIHLRCGSPVVHCDIKPSNVLLDADLVAHLGDFGLARFVLQTTQDSAVTDASSSSVGIKGTIGYAAPEHGMGSKLSTHSDIYSFGILILELFTGKRPTDNMFSTSLSLRDFVKMSIPHQVLEITDPVIFETEQEETTAKRNHHRKTYESFDECLISVYRIGIACSMELPKDRIEISKVIDQLQFVKELFLDSVEKSVIRKN